MEARHVSYKLTKTVISDGFCSYITYGIAAIDTTKKKEVLKIEDIFLDKTKAALFVDKCNKIGLSPIHLKDVIEDML